MRDRIVMKLGQATGEVSLALRVGRVLLAMIVIVAAVVAAVITGAAPAAGV